MPRPYAVSFTVSDALWMTTVGDETPLVRKRHRGRLRAYGRQVWAEAKEEGFNQVAALFTMVAAIEKDHEERYKALAANIEAGKVYARETEQVWQCRNCGFVYIGQHAPVKCPVCAHPQSYFELKSSNY